MMPKYEFAIPMRTYIRGTIEAENEKVAKELIADEVAIPLEYLLDVSLELCNSHANRKARRDYTGGYTEGSYECGLIKEIDYWNNPENGRTEWAELDIKVDPERSLDTFKRLWNEEGGDEIQLKLKEEE